MYSNYADNKINKYFNINNRNNVLVTITPMDEHNGLYGKHNNNSET